jgi:tetratricopeptide (TPR) repeat protein
VQAERVDDHVDPHAELARLLRIRRAGERFEAAFQSIASGDFDAARAHSADAQKRHPENAEYSFWAGVSLANAGYVEEDIAWRRKAFAAHPCWRELIARLPSAELLAEDTRLSEGIRHGAL